MANLYFTKDHEWLRIKDDEAVIGITSYAQEQLGDLVFVDLPQVDQEIIKDDVVVVVESVKAASDVYAPINGKVTEVNNAVSDEPSLVNSHPESDGWLWKMTITNKDQLTELLDEEAYKALIG